jgi:hypothetical protein
VAIMRCPVKSCVAIIALCIDICPPLSMRAMADLQCDHD